DRFSLKHIVPHLSELLNKKMQFCEDCVGETAKDAARHLQSEEVLLLENLRFHPEEKNGDKKFAGELEELAEVYVNDAFGTAHRAHASTSVIAQFYEPADKRFGYLMQKEVKNAEK